MQRSGGLWGDTRTAPAGLPWDWHRVPAQPVAASWAPRTAAEARPELRSRAAGPPPPRQLAGARGAPDPGDGGQPCRGPLAAAAAAADDQKGGRARGRAVRFEDAPAVQLNGGREGGLLQAWADAGRGGTAQAPACSPYQRAPASASVASPAAAALRRAGTGQAPEEREAADCHAASVGAAAPGAPGGGAAGLDGWLASAAALSRGGAGQFPDPDPASSGPLLLTPESPFAAAPDSCASSETRAQSDAAGSAASGRSAEAASANGGARYGPDGWPGGNMMGYPGSDLRPGYRNGAPFEEPPGASRCRPSRLLTCHWLHCRHVRILVEDQSLLFASAA